MLQRLLIIPFLLMSTAFFAQDYYHHDGLPCGTDEMHQQLFENHSSYNPGIIRANDELEAFTEAFKQQGSNRNGEPYIIPVVFHIIHNYGPENIDDAQIYDAVEQVNIQLRKLNEDTSDIVNQFKDIAADTEVEIRLARKDPDGNCTNGITRTVSSLTAVGDHQVKSLIHWPSDKYLNIYVCNQAAGLAGHALLPAAADTIPEWDGIVMQHSYVGTIGTSDFFRRTVVTHEIGHYLNLQHIWGGNNVPNYYYLPVAQQDNCNHDDGVDDTPLTIGWQSCPLNGSSCGDLDNVQNYMDYAYCARMFTEGQKERMLACLNSPIAGRNNLWTEQNLIETGVLGEEELCEVLFTADDYVICAGESVVFTDRSYFGVTGRNWVFEGGTASSQGDSIIEVTYNEPGFYDVTLTIDNGNSEITKMYTDFIQVIPAQGTWDGIATDFEWEPSFDDFWHIENKENPYNWSLGTPGYMSNTSVSLPNHSLTPGAQYSFHSYPIDASQLEEIVLSFDVAFARKEPSNQDALAIQISTDCGKTWTTRRNLSSLLLNSVDGEVSDEVFVPQSDEDWKNIMVTTLSSAALVDNLMVRFLFTTGGGNNIYIDNILIGHPDRLELSEEEIDDHILIYPNPAQSKISIQGTEILGKEINYELYTASGQLVSSGFASTNTIIEIDVTHVQNGLYMLHLIGEDNHRIIRRQIIMH